MKIGKEIRKIFSGVIAFAVFISTFATNICNAQVATITVNNVNTNVMTNTKLLFGLTFDSRTSLMGNITTGLIGYYDSSGVVIPQVDSIFNDFPMSTLRYPGNGIGVGFNWKKSIGPVYLRPNQNLMGTQGSPQPVKFGFDEFMAMTAAKGVPPSEIQIMVPIYDSLATGLTLAQSSAVVPNVISHNADWVEYCNAPNDSNISNPGGGIDWAEIRAANGHPTPYGIKIWNIGNEPWASGEYGGTAAGCKAYLAIATPIIDAMLAIDPTIKITMPANGNPTPGNWSYALINSTLAQQGKIYSLSQHFFGDENPATPSPSILALNTQLNSLISAAAAKNIKVFIGDYAHRIPENPNAAQKDSAMQWLGANLEADFLVLLSQKSTIERANFWVYGNATATWHPIRKNTAGNYSILPAAEIYKLLFPAFLDNSFQVTSTSPLASDGISGSYSVRSNAFISDDLNYLNIVAVNRDRNNTVPLQTIGLTGYTLNNQRLLSATSNTSETIIETTATTDVSGNFVMPPMSVLILEYADATVGINKIDFNNSTIQLYPNPTDNVLTFSETLENIEVYNSYGQLVINRIDSTNYILVAHLTTGIYFVKSDKGVMKFIVKD
ncbi:MAG: T9SS type A sorting domain-containing protein [Saprospiraceae bacterium]|nr:T9SS type A sorting domain-containing protein [Candidatus Vicinibacter affinis]